MGFYSFNLGYSSRPGNSFESPRGMLRWRPASASERPMFTIAVSTLKETGSRDPASDVFWGVGQYVRYQWPL